MPKTTHGFTGSPTYKSWDAMLTRCLNPKSPSYAGYGLRGIAVCEEWKEFQNFLRDMGPRPSKKYSLDRINNDGNYEPGNCRWATSAEQAKNKRTRKDAVVFWVNGKDYRINELADLANISYKAMYARLRSRTFNKEQILSNKF